MNSTQAQQEAVRRWGPLGAVVQFFQGAAQPFCVGTALNHGASFSFCPFGRGQSWEAAFADADEKLPTHFHAIRAEVTR
jgi:hypothetical protein